MVARQRRLLQIVGACLLIAASLTPIFCSCSGDSDPSKDATSVSSDTTLDPTVLSFRMMGNWDRDYLTIEKQTEWSDIIVAGEVVKIDTPKWNGPEGKKWKPTSGSQVAVVYTTFYVKPVAILKGEANWGTELVAFRLAGILSDVMSGTSSSQELGTVPTGRVEGQAPPNLAVGDAVVAFGRLDKGRYGGGIYEPAEAYWLTSAENSLWAGEDESLLNQGITKDPAERSLSLDSLTSQVNNYVQSQR